MHVRVQRRRQSPRRRRCVRASGLGKSHRIDHAPSTLLAGFGDLLDLSDLGLMTEHEPENGRLRHGKFEEEIPMAVMPAMVPGPPLGHRPGIGGGVELLEPARHDFLQDLLLSRKCL